jgi:hypothetical protein
VTTWISGSTWLTRYRNGERSRVWHKLRQLGATIDDPDLLEDAQLVCDERATRARRNIGLMVERLRRDD